MAVSKKLQSALWSYDLKKVDKEADKNMIISQVLNHGTWEQLVWLLKNYSIREIKKILKNPNRGEWYPEVLNYWSKILNVKLTRQKTDKAMFSLKAYGR